MKIYIHASTDNPYQYPEIYGYGLYSTMSGNDVMFCSFDKQHLMDCRKQILNLVKSLEPDESEDVIRDFCDANDIYIVQSDGYDLWQTRLDDWDDDYDQMIAAGLKDDDYIAEINNTEYKVNVIDSESFRF